MKQARAMVIVLLSIAVTTASGVQAEQFSPWKVEKLVGKKAPPFTVKDLSGRDISLSSFRGKTILLNFWATWCPYCREERGFLNSLHREYKEKGLTIIAISTDRSPEKVLSYVKSTPMDFVLLHDHSKDAASRYGVYSLPTSFLIDKEGVVKHKLMGLRNWTEKSSKKLIETLLQN
jgi:peroxiredoxin